MKESVYETQDFLMNTTVEQKICSVSPEIIYLASLEMLKDLENMMSFYRELSEISLINKSAGVKPVKISSRLMFILEQSKMYMVQSEGAFNILLAPLIQLWRKSGLENMLPSQEDIQKAQKLCKPENLILDKNEQTAFLKMNGCKIDLGGIGKGYAADACCDIYSEMGAASAFVNLGGNVKTLGVRPDNKEWIVGLQHPDKPRGNCYGAVMCFNQSVVTSGAYERFQEINGTKYHHIIDGKTGYPSQSDLKSVTVISKSSIQADAISTAAFVLGLNRGIDLVYKSKCLGAVFLTKTDQIYLTKGIKQHIKLIENLPCYEI